MKLTTVHILLEKRAHASQNPKISVNQYIATALAAAKAKKDKIGRTWNCFVSLTSVEKLGINPKSEYDTPIGIYAYPASYILDPSGAGDRAALHNVVPFAGEMEFANIFSATGNILNIGTITDAKVNSLYKKLAVICARIDPSNGRSTLVTAIDEANATNAENEVGALVDSPGGKLWYVMMTVATALAPIANSRTAVLWNKLFRELGIDGVVDLGNEIIHSNEPTQAVFFTTSALTHVQRVHNKHSPTAISNGKRTGEYRKKFSSVVRDLTDDESIITAMRTHGADLVMAIKNPSTAVQLAAVNRNGLALGYITNPSDAVKLAAVTNDGRALQFINNPSDAIQLAAVTGGKNNGQAIGWIDNPSEALQLAAVTKNPDSIYQIENPTEKVKQAAAASRTPWVRKS